MASARSAGPIGLFVTPWVQWFVQAFTQACIQSQAVVKQALDKASFRQRATSLAYEPHTVSFERHD